ncbi:MAG: RagB/SusD family nutrient uptake outer membrane protein [Prevotella sp.]|nr:RagB/SusD family nutrient uptake outer membrane protein [Prevotella sp.]
MTVKMLGAAFFLLPSAAFISCSDSFLEEKKNYGNFDNTTVYSDYNGAQERLNSLYYWLLPVSTSGDGNGTNSPNDWTSVGNADRWAKSTEEFGGFSLFVDPGEEVTYTTSTNFDYFYVANDTYSPWGHIRNCNDVIEGVLGSSLSDEQKNELLGQAYFFRAYVYSHLVRIYGGVPIIKTVQDPVLGKDGDGSKLIVPRQTTKDCIDFICEDLDKAAQMLPAQWTNGANDFGRVTSGLAQALKGWMLLYYASPVFNRSDDASRWQAAYEANKSAIALLQSGGFGLTYQANGGAANGANWARTWLDYTGSDGSVSEAVFVTLHNTKDNVSGQPDYGKYNRWEHAIRPHNTNGGGGLTPTQEMVDLFPMADGKRPDLSTIPYDKKKFWLNRDPRFYRTFAFPGVEWKFSEGGVDLTDAALNGIIAPGLLTGANYELWSYMYNDDAADLTKVTTSNGYWPDLVAGSADKVGSHSVYVRKRSDDLALHNNPFYVFINSSSNPKGFMKNAAPLITMRYAEVLLNFAEAAAGANKLDEALQALQQIRARVGYTAENNFGLDAAIAGDRAKLIAAILYERQIELAYEGKRYEDMHRWMLFDGGAGQSALKPSWAVTGFGGNTCAWLGVQPLNGTKRHSIVLYCTTPSADDPALATRPTALSLNEDMSYDAATGTYADPKVQALAQWYDANLDRKDVNADGNDDALTIQYRPTYYFMGLRQNAMQTNPTLHQTVGWHDLGRNADGLFDPLSDTLPE